MAFKLKHIFGIVILLSIIIVSFFLFPLSNNQYPNITVDSQDNLHIVWVRGEDYEQDLYYKKINPAGKTLIATKRLSRIERLLDGPEIVVDSQNNAHIFTGIEVKNDGMIIQHLVVQNGEVSFERKIKRGKETREPVATIDDEDNIYLVYSVWNQEQNEESAVGWKWDIRYYLEKLNFKGELVLGPVEVQGLVFPEADRKPSYSNRIEIHNDKLYLAFFFSDYDSEPILKMKYAELDKNGELIRLLDSPVEYYVDIYSGERLLWTQPLPVFTDESSRICLESDCVVDSNNNVYYYHGKGDGRRSYLEYKKFDQTGQIIKEGKITEFAKGPLFWIFDPVIFNTKVHIDTNNNSHIIYYINNGYNKFSVFYSKVNANGQVLIGNKKIR